MKLNLLLAITFLASCKGEQTGPYFGQTPPTNMAIVFAPNIVSTGTKERDITISSDGKEIYFCRDVGNSWNATIFGTVQKRDGSWPMPEVLPFCKNPAYHYIEPCLSPDGHQLFFVSNMPIKGQPESNDNIWYVSRINGSWENPRALGPAVNSKYNEYFPSFTNDGTIYFTAIDSCTRTEFIYRSRFINGKYQQREKLPQNVNIGTERFNAFVSSNEDFIIIPALGVPNSFGGVDYYISFRNKNDRWSAPQNMGKRVNSESPQEYSAYVSPDGNFIFFMSARSDSSTLNPLSAETMHRYHNSPQNGNSDIYWISTSIIDSLRNNTHY